MKDAIAHFTRARPLGALMLAALLCALGPFGAAASAKTPVPSAKPKVDMTGVWIGMRDDESPPAYKNSKYPNFVLVISKPACPKYHPSNGREYA